MDKELRRTEQFDLELVKNEIAVRAEAFDHASTMTDEEFDEGLEALAQFMLFGTKFDGIAVKNKKALKSLPTLNDLPLICAGLECKYAPVCQVIKNKSDSFIQDLIGKPCRDERFFAIDLFAKLVKEMAVGPENTIDLMTTATLVRYYLQKRRIDRIMQIDDLQIEEPAVIDQRTGNVYWKKVIHPLHPQSLMLEKQIESLLKQLVASRKDRLNAAAVLGKGQNLLEKLLTGDLFPDNRDAIDAEFDEEEDEE